MPKGDKYIGLKNHLQQSQQPMVKLSFEEIEQIIGNTLPPSATNHAEAWWSNNEDHSQAVAWLHAGYETDYVTDTYEDRKIVFIKK